MDDDELIEQIKQGNEKAAEELILRYYPAILRFCKWNCKNPQKAEDITQETFFKFIKNLPVYRSKKKFRTYLYTIAKHLCIDENRKPICCSLENDKSLPDACNDMRQIEDREEVKALLQLLSEKQREAVILRFGEQLSYREMEIITGCNMRTLQSRVKKALEIMRKESRYER